MIVPPFVAHGEAARDLRRRLADDVEAAWRYRTAHRRALPDFVIIGAGRSGSSFLARRVRWHPDVISNFTGREVHYFDRHRDLGERWYRMHFPLRSELRRRAERTGRRAMTGEKTPDYLELPWVADELGALRPDVRLVALLREPLDRAYSLYRMHERKQGPLPPFAEVLAAEARRLAAGEELTGGFVWGADYARHLRPWLDRFGDQLVWRAEDLYADPTRVYHEALVHLGLDPTVAPTVGEGDPVWASATGAPAEIRAEYDELFAPARADVQRLLGLDWS